MHRAIRRISSSAKQRLHRAIARYSHFRPKNTSSKVPVYSTLAWGRCSSNYVLRRSNSMEEMGAPNWALSLCLLLAWILVAACIIQGIKSSGKVSEQATRRPFNVLRCSGGLLHVAVSLRGHLCPDHSWCDLARSRQWHIVLLETQLE